MVDSYFQELERLHERSKAKAPGAVLTYLASPYSDPDPTVRHIRGLQAACVAAILLERGELVIPAIPMAEAIAPWLKDKTTDWAAWAALDLELIRRCDTLTVLAIPGWRTSQGVTAEIAQAEQLGLPIRYVDDRGNTIEP